MVKFDDVSRIMLLALIILFLIFVALQVIRIILGGSWEVETAILAITVANFTAIIGLYRELGKTNSKLGEAKADFHESMARMGADMRRDISKIEVRMSKLDGISRRINRIEVKLFR